MFSLFDILSFLSSGYFESLCQKILVIPYVKKKELVDPFFNSTNKPNFKFQSKCSFYRILLDIKKCPRG